MKNRIVSPSPAERRAFGLVAWLEQTRVILPLKGVECSFSVCGDVVSVEIDQIFHQNSPQPLDCLYTFPLPAGAAVYRCEMHVNGRVIRARVEEREAARKLAEHSHSERPVSLLLITDGQVGNEAAVLNRLGQHTDLRVDVFGIDVAMNDGFLSKLAAQHQGTSCLMSPKDDIAGAVARLGDRLRKPVLRSIEVQGDWELAGRRLSNLHAGEVLLLPLRGQKAAAHDKRVTIQAKDTHGATRCFELELAPAESPALRLLWAKQRINFLLAQGQSAEAIALAKSHNLVCEGAAFVAWDEAEKVQVSGPDRELYQPAMAPAGAPMLLRCFEAPMAGAYEGPKGLTAVARSTAWGDAHGKGLGARLESNDYGRLEELCRRVGRDDWLKKCERLAEWAVESGIPQVLFRLRCRKLEVLIQLLKADVKRIIELNASVRLELENPASPLPAVQESWKRWLRSPYKSPLQAKHREALLSALGQDAAGEKLRELLRELDNAERQMQQRIDEFLQRHVEETPEAGRPVSP